MENLGEKETEQEAKRTEPGPSIDLYVVFVVVVSKLERSHDFCASLDAKQLMREGEEKIIAKFYVIWSPPTRHIDETFSVTSSRETS